MTAASRRTFLAAGGGLLFSTALDAPALAAGTKGRKRAYVIVVDGCRPDEIDGDLTPTLKALRSQGLRFPRASSMPVMETIPNHVMMMTGVRPDRSGVPANEIYDRSLQATRTMDRPADIRVRTVIERLNGHGFTTGTVLSKEYLYGVFGARATHRWEPSPVVPVSGHAPDQFTMDAALAMVDEFDPNLVFVNLGDIDRFGHADVTGTTLRLARQAALADTDQQVKRFVDMLKSTGRWRHSVVIVLADHSMDWSTPDQIVSLQGPMDADPMLAGQVQIACNGGADLLYWTGPVDRPGRGDRADAGGRERRARRARRPCPHRGLAAARPGGGRRRGLLQGRLALHRPRPDGQPDPRQPRPPGDPADPVLHRRRAPAGAPGPGLVRARAHRRRRADAGVVLRGGPPARRLGRSRPALTSQAPTRPALVSRPSRRAGSAPCARPRGRWWSTSGAGWP